MALQIRTEVHPPQAHIVFTIDKNRPRIEKSLLRFVQKQVFKSYTSIIKLADLNTNWPKNSPRNRPV